MMPSSFKRILQTPKRYVLNLKNDFLALKCNKASIVTFMKKHPLLSLKVFHSNLIALARNCFCSFSSEIYRLMDIIFIDSKIYRNFFSYLTKFKKECFASDNFFSDEYVVSKKKYSRLVKYFHCPFLTFFADFYSLFKTKPKKSIIELTEESFIAPE